MGLRWSRARCKAAALGARCPSSPRSISAQIVATPLLGLRRSCRQGVHALISDLLGLALELALRSLWVPAHCLAGTGCRRVVEIASRMWCIGSHARVFRGVRNAALVSYPKPLRRVASAIRLMEGASGARQPAEGAPAGQVITACDATYYGLGRSVCDGQWYAWCELTGEQVCLRPPVCFKYHFQMDEDGDVMLVDGEEAMSLGDFMHRMLYIDGEGVMYTVAASGDAIAPPQMLQCELRAHKPWRVTISFVGRAPEQCDIFVYALPRLGAHVAWSLHDVVRAMRLEVIDEDRPARWVYGRWDSWDRFCAKELGRPLDLRRPLQRADDRELLGDDVRRDLPVPSIFTPSLLGLLVRLASRSRAMGGMKSAGDRTQVLEFLSAILAELSFDDFELYLFFDADVQVHHPALWHGRHLLRLNVESGRIAMEELWRHDVGRRRDQDGKMLVMHLRLESDDMVQLPDFLVSVATLPPASWGHLTKQLVWQCGNRLDSLLAFGSSALRRLKCQCVVDEPFESSNPKQVDAALVRYWQAGIAAIQGCREVSLSLDKTRGNSKGLSNAVLVLPENQAWWTPPQVVSGPRPERSIRGRVGFSELPEPQRKFGRLDLFSPQLKQVY